ncbi:MAG: C2H2-type zinc finger protein [Candidatus Endonucleobacter sp. (ex Gigantidas childressi)]|nr:C2H2-type zinc finger protein [Candidatus Endonucleobacter sp. (ex Gigantidas childressi)]
MLNLYHQLFTQRISLVAAIKCMLFSYCWLISCCIQAGLDDYVFGSINIKNEIQEWHFRYISPTSSKDIQNDLCVMIDKCIMLDEETEKQVSGIMLNMLQKNKALEFHHMTNNHSLQVDVSNDSLSVADIIIWIQYFLEGYKAYESVHIGILTLDKVTEVIRYEIKTLSIINHESDYNGAIIEGRCSELTILTKLLVLGVCVRYASENSATVNDVDCEQLPCLHQTKNILSDGVLEFKKSTAAHTKVPVKEKKFFCKCCNKAFERLFNLREHESIHTDQPYACKVCGNNFSSKGNLSKHMKIHSDARPFRCTDCDKSFKSNSNLIDHKRTHTGEQSCICQYCDKAFSRKSNLTVHIRTHTGERPFSCQYCPSAFNSKSHLTVHIRTHTGERPFPCQDCPSAFNSKSHLTEHIRVHTGERPFVCRQCNRTYTHSRSLKSHVIKIHIDKKPDDCEKSG